MAKYWQRTILKGYKQIKKYMNFEKIYKINNL